MPFSRALGLLPWTQIGFSAAFGRGDNSGKQLFVNRLSPLNFPIVVEIPATFRLKTTPPCIGQIFFRVACINHVE
jgi:hypothetical protein